MVTMLFPAVHQLGFQAGQAVSLFWYNCWRTMETHNLNARTILALLTDARLLRELATAGLVSLVRLPGLYKTWWWNLVTKDPLHVAIETVMIMCMVYMALSRSTEGYKDLKDKLNLREQEELLWEWKHQTRAPLAPPPPEEPSGIRNPAKDNDDDDEKKIPRESADHHQTDRYGDDYQIVVQKQEGKWLTVTVPNHWVDENDINKNNSSKSSNNNTNKYNTTTNNTIGATTKSALIEKTNNNHNKASNSHRNHRGSSHNHAKKTPSAKKNGIHSSNSSKPLSSSQRSPPTTTTSKTTKAAVSRETTELRVLNFCNFDFLGFQTSEALRQASTKALNKYGCGSCGPRGFYGTIDAHLQLEEEISRFCQTEQAILYSDGASACSSTVAAFAKRGDVLVVDEGVYEPLSTGVYLSRANVHWFRHNDVQDLERVLKELQVTDKKLGRKPGAQRRFIVVEGLYKNLGTIAPLDEIVALKHKYKYRLILDESFSFGTLGKTGRGSLEEHHKRPMYDSEITTIALENSVGSIGGVTVGTEEVVDHQRLSGAGYCFSASAPPFTASAAVASLRILEERPDLVQRLQANVRYTYQLLTQNIEDHNRTMGKTNSMFKLVVTSDSRSPIVVVQLEQESIHESAIMSGIMRNCLRRGIGIVASTTGEGPCSNFGFSAYNGTNPASSSATELAPCIRMTVSALHTQEDADQAIHTLMESVAEVASSYPSPTDDAPFSSTAFQS